LSEGEIERLERELTAFELLPSAIVARKVDVAIDGVLREVEVALVLRDGDERRLEHHASEIEQHRLELAGVAAAVR